MTAMIRIRDLRMTYRNTQVEQPAVRGVSLEVKEGAFYTLLGPSGCGKTTTLRCVAGLERPDAGEIAIGDEVVYSSERNVWVAPYDRNIGMVFQSYAIWPHMTVFDNIAFPLRYMRPKPTRGEIRERVAKALALVRLEGLEDRPAPYLSGGQQQRLAVARALVAEPRVLLLDEPLSNLDAKLRDEMRLELREMVARLRLTTLFVTHEQMEALTMSDAIGVMKDGVIVQEGTPSDIYARPLDPFVADFIGKTNILTGRVVALNGAIGTGRASVETPAGVLGCRIEDGTRDGETVSLTVRPENITLVTEQTSGKANVVTGRIESVVFLGNMLDCVVAVGPARIHVQLHPSSAPRRGAQVHVHMPPEHCLAMRHSSNSS